MPLPQRKLIPGILVILMIAAFAAPPLWWSQGTDPVISTTATANNHGPANIGQAKHVAKSALDALALVLPDVAADIEADLVGPGKIIPSWAPPANQAEKDKNHAPLLIGQLKAIAHPFYNHLNTAAPSWLETERTTNGTNHPGSIFPWTAETTDDQNKAIANIGQLKAVFSLRFNEALTNGLPYLWQWAYWGETGIDPQGDADGDGFNNLEEYLAGTHPRNYYSRPGGNLNLPPIVGIGPDQTILWPAHEILLEADAIDPDGGPQPLNVTWTKVSEPGSITFGDEQALSTAASFSQPGTYLLQLAATDGPATTTALLVVNVLPSPLPAPMVRFVVPEHQAILDQDSDFVLWIKAADEDGPGISSVSLYRNGQLIHAHPGGNLNSYLTNWNEAALGAVTFTAVATNDAGVSSSASITLSFYPTAVGPPPFFGPGGGGGGAGGGGAGGGGGVPVSAGSFKTLPIPEQGPLGFPSEFEVITEDQEEISDEYHYTGEPGQAVLLEVVVFSEEYPGYTGQQSQYDDVASWTVQPAWASSKSGTHRVNVLHEKFNDDKEAIVGFFAIRFPTDEDPEKRKLTFKATVQNIADGVLDTSVQFRLLPVEIVPDYNRDGMINDEDRNKVTEEKPFVFWTNDDDDSNAEPHYGDIPGSQVDGADMAVNDLRDLVDFFPVQLRTKELLAALPADKYTYKISHPTGAFHFIEMPDVHPDSSPLAQGAGAYLRNPTMAGEAMARPMLDTAGQGAELSAEYLNVAKDDTGVLLFEAKSATNQSFELIISKKDGGAEIARITRAMPVEIADVEKMFWRANIRPAAYGQTPGAVVEPESPKFKASRKDQWFVFCHGYNVSAEAARGWNAEVFKRLHQQGSDARFVGVSWEGNQGQVDVSLFFEKMFTPDYWRNVYNAFSSSHALTTQINGLTGSSKSKTVIAAHSLGNMLVSSAICDHGLKAEQYFMFNSAVPREAYSAGYVAQDRGSMRNPDWQPYPNRLWSTDWKNLYAANDGRNKLSWQDRFASLLNETTPFNYYSTGEDVAAGSVGGGKPSAITVAFKGSGAWISQEMNKGLATKAAVNGFATGNWSAGGGWAFNLNHYTEYRPNPLDPPGAPLPDTAAITSDQLRANPFFKPFTKLKVVNGGANPAADGTDITGATGSAHASQYVIRAWMLAHEIPSLSKPTASGPLTGVSEGGDMETNYKSGNWGNDKWTHSAMRERDPQQVWKLYNKMCEQGNLRKP